MAVYQNTSSVTFGDSFPSRGSLLKAFPLRGAEAPGKPAFGLVFSGGQAGRPRMVGREAARMRCYSATTFTIAWRRT